LLSLIFLVVLLRFMHYAQVKHFILIPLYFLIYSLILLYSFSNKTHFGISLIKVYILFSESLYFESVFLFKCVLIVIISFVFKLIIRVKSFKILSLNSYFIQFLSLLLLQLYSFKNITFNNLQIEERVYKMLGFDVFILMNRLIHIGMGTAWNEFNFIGIIFNLLKNFVNFNL